MHDSQMQRTEQVKAQVGFVQHHMSLSQPSSAQLSTAVCLNRTLSAILLPVLADGRHMIDEKFQSLVLDEIAAVRSELKAEQEERVAEDEQIVGAINDYTRALQDGLRLVSS